LYFTEPSVIVVYYANPLTHTTYHVYMQSAVQLISVKLIQIQIQSIV